MYIFFDNFQLDLNIYPWLHKTIVQNQGKINVKQLEYYIKY